MSQLPQVAWGRATPFRVVLMPRDPEAVNFGLMSLLLTPSVEGQREWLSISLLVMSKVLKMC